MEINEYQELAKKTAKKFENKDLEISTWGLGIAGEAGDVASCIKKTFAHENKVIEEGIKENLGDTFWYAAMICNFFGWKLEDVLNENIEKLKKRYPEGFKIENAKRGGTKAEWAEDS